MNTPDDTADHPFDYTGDDKELCGNCGEHTTWHPDHPGFGGRGVSSKASEYEQDTICGTCGAYWQCSCRGPESVKAGLLDVDATPNVSDPKRRPDVQLHNALDRMASSPNGRFVYQGSAMPPMTGTYPPPGQLAQDAMARPSPMPLSQRFDKPQLSKRGVNNVGKTWTYPGVYGGTDDAYPLATKMADDLNDRAKIPDITVQFTGVDDLVKAFRRFRYVMQTVAQRMTEFMWAIMETVFGLASLRAHIDNPHIERPLEELYVSPLVPSLGARAPPV